MSITVSRIIENFTRIIVSLPIDLSSSEDAELAKLEEKGVKGRYASVERIQELENGHTEWLMATSSTPGGFLPTFVVEASVASMIPNVSSHCTLQTSDLLMSMTRMYHFT